MSGARRAAAYCLLLIVSTGCAGQGNAQEAVSQPSRSHPGTATPSDEPSAPPLESSPAGPAPSKQPQESDKTVESCPQLPKYLRSPRSKIPNPCAQYTEILRLFHRNHYWKNNYGFRLKAARPGVEGLKLAVAGNIENARKLLADNSLVASVELGYIHAY